MPPNEPGACHLGIGLSSAANLNDALRLFETILQTSDRTRPHVVSLSTLEGRRGHPVLVELSTRLSLPVTFYGAAELQEETSRLQNPSEALYRQLGCHGVAEAACLRSAGRDASLLIGKTSLGGVTMALAGWPVP